jgi:hypothetical protein
MMHQQNNVDSIITELETKIEFLRKQFEDGLTEGENFESSKNLYRRIRSLENIKAAINAAIGGKSNNGGPIIS